MIHPRPQDTLPQSLEDLQDAYPGWSIWQAAGQCYATRLAPRLTGSQLRAGMSMTVHADEPEGLTAELAGQADAERSVTA